MNKEKELFLDMQEWADEHPIPPYSDLEHSNALDRALVCLAIKFSKEISEIFGFSIWDRTLNDVCDWILMDTPVYVPSV